MNKKVVGALGLASVALVGGTFAYFTQTATIDNPFNTAQYGTVVTEDFKPEEGDKWQPGAEVNKDVYVDNTGDRDVVVRVKFLDIWKRDGEDLNSLLTNLENNAANKLTVTEPSQLEAEDGLTEGDGTVVHKYFAEGYENDWFYNEEDGYFYYRHNLAPNASTGKFLDSVRLKEDVDMGLFQTWFYWTDAEAKPATSKDLDTMVTNGWKLVEGITNPQPGKGATVTAPEGSSFTAAVTIPEKDKLGYSEAEYTLRITIETVQATDKAVRNTFGEAALLAMAGEWNLTAEDLAD